MGILDGAPPGTETEGVIKFNLHYDRTPPLPAARLTVLQAWRKILFDLNLIGPTGSEPVSGFGNVSERLDHRPHGRSGFIITGTQTGHKPALNPRDYGLVTGWNLDANWIEAEGPCPPSSESLTHAVFYQFEPRVHFVFHAHSPEIWSRAGALDLAMTSPKAAYGTPDMARAVHAILTFTARSTGLIVMGGHQDGVMSYGPSADAAGLALVQALAKARGSHVSINDLGPCPTGATPYRTA